MEKRSENLVIGFYFHPEAYPPTLNAIDELSECFNRISVVHRPHLRSAWAYPANVHLVESGRFLSENNQKTASLPKKFLFFFQFMSTFTRECLRRKPAVILVYDSMSLYAYHLVRKLLRFPHKVWYHNHDVVEKGLLRKYSIGWLAAQAESAAFDYLDIFSLPTSDRLSYFNMDRFKGRYFLVPNYPSLRFYGSFYRPHPVENTVRLIFQGQVSASRGIEWIIPLLNRSVAGKQIELTLLGPSDLSYKAGLIRMSEEYGVAHQVRFDRLPYRELPAYTTTCHVGLALLADSSIMSATMGTASNKVFEYAALGLPVLYHSASLEQHLGPYKWARQVSLHTDRIHEELVTVVQSYDTLSALAYNDFRTKLNYQAGFSDIKHWIADLVADPATKKNG